MAPQQQSNQLGFSTGQKQIISFRKKILTHFITDKSAFQY